MARKRDWCFTLNNYTEEDLTRLEKFDEKYLIFGFEEGKSGTKHLQGYVEFNNPRCLSGVKKLIANGGHFEERKGSPEQAIKYCKKDGNWCEFGTPGVHPGKGVRSDLDGVYMDFLDGYTVETVALRHPSTFMKYSRGIHDFHFTTIKAEKWREIKVIVLIGPTGVGKTKEAMNHDSVYKLNQPSNGTLWFDGYDGEYRLILDDFTGWIKYRELLTILDGYPYRCQIKGASIWAQWKEVYITSNEEVDEWYKCRDISALRRRITETRIFSTEVKNAQKWGG